MTHTLIISKGKKDLIFKGIRDFVIYPGCAKLILPGGLCRFGQWHTIEEVDGVILHKEKED